MLPSRAYVGVVGEPGQRGRDGGRPGDERRPSGSSPTSRCRRWPSPCPTSVQPVPVQGGVRVGQHRHDRHAVRDARQPSGSAEVAVGAPDLGQHGGRDPEQLQQLGGPGQIRRCRRAGCVTRCRPRSACRSPPVSRQISQESTVPTADVVEVDAGWRIGAASAILGAENIASTRSPVRSRTSTSSSASGPVAAPLGGAASCQPITGPRGSPVLRSPGHHRLPLGGQGHRRQVDVRRRRRGQAPVDRGQHAGPDLLGVLLDPARTRVSDTRPAPSRRRRRHRRPSTSTALVLVVPWSIARTWVIA